MRHEREILRRRAAGQAAIRARGSMDQASSSQVADKVVFFWHRKSRAAFSRDQYARKDAVLEIERFAFQLGN